ncbi:protein BTG2-like [Octopus sinensis]|uniref:Protein BTG2-like n=1 Tax=Octopus sinensis TaxID=2607531 RepID=A0A6P7SIE1_9MOLL|nr:protein BTG2-like [Octopus sinensis]
MMNEVASATEFLSSILRTHSICTEKTDLFKCYLQSLLLSHYRDHWFPEKPNKGSGYRCLRMNHKMDPLIKVAGERCGFTEEEIFTFFPRELTVWIDPLDVSYRIGENGSIGILYRGTSSSSLESCSTPGNNTTYTSNFSSSISNSSIITPRPNNNTNNNNTTTNLTISSPSTSQSESKGTALLSSCKDQFINSLPITGDSMKHLATCVFS